MDKPKNNRTITIKINGNEQAYTENSQKEEKEIDSNEIVEPIQSSEMESLSELAASQEAIEESFDWILPEDDDDEIDEYIIAKPTTTKHKTNTNSLKKHLNKQNIGPLKSLIFSILLAIIIGTSFGFIVLKLVINDGTALEETLAPIVSEDTVTTTDNMPNGTGEGESLSLEPINTFIIQGGVFSSVDSAKVEAEKVKQKGVAAQIVEANGKAVLVLGLADTIEKAKAIGTGIKERGLDVFAKPYDLPAKNLQSLSAVEINFLKEAPSVYATLASLSSSGMLSESIDANLLNEQKTRLQVIQKEDIKSENIEKLLIELEGAIGKLESYEQQQKQSTLIEAQQHLLTFIATYFTL